MLVQQEDVYSNFVNSIKSYVTRRIYEYNLRLFMEFCGIYKFEDLIGQQNKIISYLMSLRDKKLSFNSISTVLNKNLIRSYTPILNSFVRKALVGAFFHRIE